MSLAIKVENVGKKYILDHKKQESYTALRDVIMNKIKTIGKSEIDNSNNEEFWALRDISCDINQGDRFGIIGRNGAGKSTLLKIISRITEPTTGKISIRGRVASLLEVGTGFHPELTGRENIFLNGSILGMSKIDIKNKFDEIVEFAEVQKFLDTPVKRYSSGMYVRLAFAVAAHMEPEILVVDEVLAVGDMQFHKKCLGKMEDVSKKEGRTILFVSHNMAMISSLCDKCILLSSGKISDIGKTAEVINKYNSNDINLKGEVDYTTEYLKHGDETACFLKARIIDEEGTITTDIRIDKSFYLEMEYIVLREKAEVTPNFHFFTSEGVYAFITTDTCIDPNGEMKKIPGIYKCKCKMPGNFFNSGSYSVGFALSTMKTSEVHFNERNLLHFDIMDPIDGVITRGQYVGNFPGVIRPMLSWESEMIK